MSRITRVYGRSSYHGRCAAVASTAENRAQKSQPLAPSPTFASSPSARPGSHHRVDVVLDLPSCDHERELGLLQTLWTLRSNPDRPLPTTSSPMPPPPGACFELGSCSLGPDRPPACRPPRPRIPRSRRLRRRRRGPASGALAGTGTSSSASPPQKSSMLIAGGRRALRLMLGRRAWCIAPAVDVGAAKHPLVAHLFKFGKEKWSRRWKGWGFSHASAAAAMGCPSASRNTMHRPIWGPDAAFVLAFYRWWRSTGSATSRLPVMAKAKNSGGWDLSSLRSVGTGAALLGADLWLELREGYGLRESAGAATFTAAAQEASGRPGAVGQ